MVEGTPPDDGVPPPDDAQLGEPIAELAALEEAPAAGFADRIRRGILRRIAGVHALEFAFESVLEFLREIGALIFGAPDTASRRKE